MLSHVKVGDTLICNRYLYKVERLTQQQIICDKGGRFRKEKGDMVGGATRYYAKIATKEEIEAIQEKALHEMLVSKVWNFKKWYEVSLDDLRTIDEILKKYEVRR